MILLAALLAGGLFRDVTETAGLAFRHRTGARGERYLPETMGAGACVLDFDGDLRLDLFLVQSGNVPGGAGPSGGGRGSLYRNLGGGRFEDVTERAGIPDTGYGQGAACADYDGDGHVDIYVTSFGPNHLLRNRGDGRFQDVTAAAGVGDPAWSVGAAFFDADGDGDLDLYVANYLRFSVATHRDCTHRPSGRTLYCHPDVYPAAPDTFYRNRGNGTFEDATVAAGFAEKGGKGLGVLAADLDGDARPDLYVANDSTPNFLFRNLGGGRFEEAGFSAGVALDEQGRAEAGMGVDAGDVNADGRPDIIVTNLSLEANALYVSEPGSFSYGSRRAGLYDPSYGVLGFGVHFADLDRDGDLDLVVVNGDVLDNVEVVNDGLSYRQPGQVFANDGRGRFRELPAGETGDFATPRVGRGSALVDFDDDGALDLLVSYSGDQARLYRNESAPAGWVGFRLQGRPPNPGAVGAQVTVHAGGRIQSREMRAGSGYASGSDPRLHFGLGDAGLIERVIVRWPRGRVQELRGLPAGRYHALVEPAP